MCDCCIGYVFLLHKLGYVGRPLPEVQCRLVDEQEQEIKESNTPGELRIKVIIYFVFSNIAYFFFCECED